MNFISMINIQSERKQSKTVKINKKQVVDRNYGYSVYEALEFNKNNQARSSLGLQLQILQDFSK